MDNQLNRLLDNDRDLDTATPGQAGSAGKSTLTSRLSPAPQVVFRVSDPETARALGESLSGGARGRIQREADGAAGGRDANGVAAGAEVAVDRAASSSGAPLPSHLQRQFEGSLGADLSGVRVHTGGESATAAHAVGAKAYTVGQDIHFGAGKYQPEDPFGMHLLAHEVAHTVQQAGGAQRRQHKLEVSAPQDAAEHEADRAADAMVRGLPTTVSMIGTGAARQVVQRDEDFPTLPEEIDKATTAAERNTRDAQAKPDYKPGAVLSNRYSQQEARTRLKKAQAETANLEGHATSGSDGVTWDQVNTNHGTIAELTKYADMRDSEASDLGSLVTGQQTLQQDFARLNASVSTVQQSLGIKNADAAKMATPENPVDHTKPLSADGQTGQKMGEAIGDRATLGDKETGKTSALAEMRVLTNNAISDYNKSIADVNASSTGMKAASSGLKLATSSLALFNLKQENKDLTAELQAAQAEAKNISDSVSAVTGLIVACAGISGGLATSLGAGGLPELKPSIDPVLKAIDSKAGAAGLSTVNDLITKILLHTSGIDGKIDRVTGALKKNEFAQLRTEKATQGAQVKKAAQELEKSVQEYKRAVADADAKKQTMRTALKDYGARLDKQAEKDGTGGGQRFEVVGKVMGECDAFIGQANLMWGRIKSYKESSASAKDQRNAVNEGVKGGDGRKYGMALWSVESVPAANTYLVNCENIQLHMSGSEAGGKDQNVRPQDAVARIEGEVKQAGSIAFGMRNQLAVFMGLNLAGTKPEFMG